MENRYNAYRKLLLALALGFSFAAEASNHAIYVHESAVAAVQEDEIAQLWQKELLGMYADINSLTAANLREAYITLLVNVREKKGNWDDQDWNKAKAVINRLDARKNSMEKELSTDEKAKIKLLQAELRTLETAGDIKD